MGIFPHRIRRQRWNLRACSVAAAFDLRRRLRDDWQEVLLPAFESVFDQEAPGTDVVQIPRLELVLKIGPEETAGGSWSRLLQERLLRQLREIMRGRPNVPEKPAQWK